MFEYSRSIQNLQSRLATLCPILFVLGPLVLDLNCFRGAGFIGFSLARVPLSHIPARILSGAWYIGRHPVAVVPRYWSRLSS